MKYKFLILNEAKIDFKEAFNWYKDINIELAISFLSSFKDVIKIIKTNPELFQIRYDNSRVKLLKGFPYLIHYKIIDNLIIVYLICHTSRDNNLNSK